MSQLCGKNLKDCLKSMTKIFFDTEFTGLFKNAQLISIGLIDESGTKVFYAETSGLYGKEDCSEFCQKEVLCHLQGGNVKMNVLQLQCNLIKWLESFKKVKLVCDNVKDKEQLERLLPNTLPKNCKIIVLGVWGNLRRNLSKHLYKKYNLRVHHALDDAKLNRLALTKWFPT